MTEQPVTLQVLAESLLQDLLDNIIRQQTLQSVSRYKSLKENVGSTSDEKGKEGTDVVSRSYQNIPSKDIYGQDRGKLKTSEGSRYFQCENCGRKISGGRFASHINKCLERRGR